MTNIKQAGKQVIAHLYYENYMKRVRRDGPLVDVCSVSQTISMLQTTDHSLVRFGDGELTFIRNCRNDWRIFSDIPMRDLWCPCRIFLAG